MISDLGGVHHEYARIEFSEGTGLMLKRILLKVWRSVPESVRRRFWLMVNPLRDRALRILINYHPCRKIPPPDAPIVIAGLFRSANGLGEAARATYWSLRAAGLAPIAVDVTDAITIADIETGIPLSALPKDRRGTLILHVNGPETEPALRSLGFLRGRKWRVIGYWAWELPTFPEGWNKAFGLVSELWTLSEFTASSLQRDAGAPRIHSLPIAITLPKNVVADRARFGLSNEAFVVLTMADARSSFGRKNPLGAIAAFRTAFGDRAEFQLIVKTRNIESSPQALSALNEAIDGATNISLLDGAMTNEERWTLLASVDTLVSLHRAEGFGLSPAEAMALGKPVIATGWSGNMSFMTADSSLLVNHELVRVNDPFGIYRDDDAQWAEPDVDHAAALLARLAADKELAERIGAVARRRIADICDPQIIGLRMAALLRGEALTGA